MLMKMSTNDCQKERLDFIVLKFSTKFFKWSRLNGTLTCKQCLNN